MRTLERSSQRPSQRRVSVGRSADIGNWQLELCIGVPSPLFSLNPLASLYNVAPTPCSRPSFRSHSCWIPSFSFSVCGHGADGLWVTALAIQLLSRLLSRRTVGVRTLGSDRKYSREVGWLRRMDSRVASDGNAPLYSKGSEILAQWKSPGGTLLPNNNRGAEKVGKKFDANRHG